MFDTLVNLFEKAKSFFQGVKERNRDFFNFFVVKPFKTLANITNTFVASCLTIASVAATLLIIKSPSLVFASLTWVLVPVLITLTMTGRFDALPALVLSTPLIPLKIISIVASMSTCLKGKYHV